jgi:hypothetical protein
VQVNARELGIAQLLVVVDLRVAAEAGQLSGIAAASSRLAGILWLDPEWGTFLSIQLLST